jgi:hypothetical protein
MLHLFVGKDRHPAPHVGHGLGVQLFVLFEVVDEKGHGATP